MYWKDVLMGLLGGGLVATLFQVYLNHRFSQRRERAAENREQERRIREASAAVANLIGTWVRPSYFRKDGHATNEDRWEIQTAYWEAIMWLDEDLLRKVIQLLARQNGQTTNQVIVEARRVLLGNAKTTLSANELNNWLPLNEPQEQVKS